LLGAVATGFPIDKYLDEHHRHLTAIKGEEPGGNEAACVQCGGIFKLDDMIAHGSHHVCASCKPIFLQKLAEGAPVAPQPPESKLVLFTFKFPEMESVPPEQREELLRRCAESVEVRRLRARWRYAPFVAVLIAPAVAIGTMRWSGIGMFITLVITVAGTFVVSVALRIFLEVRLIRRLLRKQSHGDVAR
jgi:hypothetical protein